MRQRYPVLSALLPMAMGIAAAGCRQAGPSQEAAASPTRPTSQPTPTASSAAARARHLGARIAAAQQDARYHVRSLEPGTASKAALYAHSPEQRLAAHFEPGAVVLRPDTHPDLATTMSTRELRCGGRWYGVEPALPRPMQEHPNRLTYTRKAGLHTFTEWWANGAPGLEHGFTFESAPCESDSFDLEILLSFQGLSPSPGGDGHSVILRDSHGTPRLRYGSLFAQDARGRAVPASMHVDAGAAVLHLNLEGAQFPVEVDPLVETLEDALLHKFPTEKEDYYGRSLAMSGDYAVVGAPYSKRLGGHNAGAYVFQHTDSGWVPMQELIPSDGARAPSFGEVVDIDGDTLVALSSWAREDEESGPVGAAYLFTLENGTWVEEARISGGPHGRLFGQWAALDGDTLVVSGQAPDQAHVFVRSGTTWSHQQSLTTSGSTTNDGFGPVAVDGDVLVIGAYQQNVIDDDDRSGAAYIFERSGSTWTETTMLPGPVKWGTFGWQVAADGDRVMVTCRDDGVYVYERGSSGWSEIDRIRSDDYYYLHDFGSGIELQGDRAIVGAPQADEGMIDQAGAVYVFDWNGSDFVQQQKIVTDEPLTHEGFGRSVAADGERLLVSAESDVYYMSDALNAVHAYEGSPLSKAGTLVAEGDGANDYLGESISISGDTIVSGAWGEDDGQGAVYVFERTDGVLQPWPTRLVEPVRQDNARFGGNVFVEGDYLFAAASDRSDSYNGEVHVYRRNGAAWEHLQVLTAPNATSSDMFGGDSGSGAGQAIHADGELLVIGAPQAGPQSDGAAYVYHHNGSSWDFEQELSAPEDSLYQFGTSVGISGNRIVVGSLAGGQPGAVFVFERTSSTWSPMAKLMASDGEGSDLFGGSVAIDRDTIAVGAWGDMQATDVYGAVYVFHYDGSDWIEQDKLVPASPPTPFNFGGTVALQGDMLVSPARQGSAANDVIGYVFVRSGSQWMEELELTNSDLEYSGYYQQSAAVDGELMALGFATATVGTIARQGLVQLYSLRGLAGQSCTNSNQCATPYSCVDGVCCSTACAEACAVCAASEGAVRDGTCTPAPDGTTGAPACGGHLLCDGTRMECPGLCTSDADCTGDRYCSAQGSCLLAKAQGSPCNDLDECAVPGDCELCATGQCVDGYCCDTACDGPCDTCALNAGASANGTCGPRLARSAGQPSCAGAFVCDGANAACPTRCEVDADCLPGHFCEANACIAQLGLGTPCDGDEECQGSLTCADGVCCGSQCDDRCDVCSATLGAPADGVCGATPGGASGSPACAGGFLCDGESAVCPTSCDLDSDCGAGRFCDAEGRCVPQRSLGAACDPLSDCRNQDCNLCQSGHCVDGVCCDGACDDPCDVCAVRVGASVDGQCAVQTAGGRGGPACAGNLLCDGERTTCPSGCTATSDCATGYFCSARGTCEPAQQLGEECSSADDCGANLFCVDGVCCNTQCDRQCEACDVEGSAGTCSPVRGEPHGARPACGGSDADCLGTCDGQKRDGCAFPDLTQSCGESVCDSAVTQPRVCNGAGDCVRGTERNCAPYACNTDRTACSTSCEVDGDCAAGAVCDTRKGECAFTDATCIDLTTLQTADGARRSCAPYTCQSSQCLRECMGDSECVEGFRCEQGECLADESAAPGDADADAGGGSKGCSASVTQASSPASLVWLALGAGVLWIRRRSTSMA